MSLGQLDEHGCKSVIEGGVLCLYDRQRVLLARVQRTSNRLYAVALNLAAPVCLLAGALDALELAVHRAGGTDADRKSVV